MMSSLFHLFVVLLAIFTCINSSHIICSKRNECKDLTIACAPNESCDVECTGKYSCRNSQIHCSSNDKCSITCSANYACSGVAIYCPPHLAPTNIKNCHINGDDINSRDGPIHIYALHGWNDVSINSSHYIIDGIMHCTSTYSASCTFASNAWLCGDSHHICNGFTIAPTVAIYPTESTLQYISTTAQFSTESPSISTNTPTTLRITEQLSVSSVSPSNAPTYNHSKEHKQMTIYIYYNDSVNGINMIFGEYMKRILLKTYDAVTSTPHEYKDGVYTSMAWKVAGIMNITFCVVFNHETNDYDSQRCHVFHNRSRRTLNATIESAQFIAFGTFIIAAAESVDQYETFVTETFTSNTFLNTFTLYMNDELQLSGFKDTLHVILIKINIETNSSEDKDDEHSNEHKPEHNPVSMNMTDIIILVLLVILVTTSLIVILYISKYCCLNAKRCKKHKHLYVAKPNPRYHMHEEGATDTQGNDTCILEHATCDKPNAIFEDHDTDDLLQQEDEPIDNTIYIQQIQNEYISSDDTNSGDKYRNDYEENNKSVRLRLFQQKSGSQSTNVCVASKKHKNKRSYHWGFTTENDGEIEHNHKHSVQLTLSSNNSDIANQLDIKRCTSMNSNAASNISKVEYRGVDLEIDDDDDVDENHEMEKETSASFESMYDSVATMDGLPLTRN